MRLYYNVGMIRRRKIGAKECQQIINKSMTPTFSELFWGVEFFFVCQRISYQQRFHKALQFRIDDASMHHQTTSQSCATTQTTIFVDDLYSLTHSIEKYFGEVSINRYLLVLVQRTSSTSSTSSTSQQLVITYFCTVLSVQQLER